MERNLEVVDRRLVWLLWVLVPILSLHDIIEAALGLPSCFVELLLFLLDLILVYDWERQAQVLG